MLRYALGNIRIDGSELSRWFFGLFKKSDGDQLQNSYESDVLAQLNRLSPTQTGRAVFRALDQAAKSKGKSVRIVPYQDSDDNAYALPTDGPEARDAAPKGVKQYMGGPDDVKTPEDEREMKSDFEGTGLGSNVELHFNPRKLGGPPESTCPVDGRKWTHGCPAYAGAYHEKDAQLLHELVHAVRETRGEFNQVPTWNRDWMNEEEFFAILVTNIYLSERGRKDLRGNSLGFGVLQPPLNTSEGFIGKGGSPSRDQLEHRKMVSKFATQTKDLCIDIKQNTKAEFNPIREYVSNPRIYPVDPG